MRLFNESEFLGAARVEISEQIGTCARDLQNLGDTVGRIDTSALDERGHDLLNEVLSGVNQIKTLFESSNKMVANIEHYLLSNEFPSKDEMSKSIKDIGAEISSLDEIDEYKSMDADTKQKYAFVASNYELISTMLDNALELCAVLHKAAKRL